MEYFLGVSFMDTFVMPAVIISVIIVAVLVLRRRNVEHFARISQTVNQIKQKFPEMQDLNAAARKQAQELIPHAPRETDFVNGENVGTSVCYMRVGPDGPCCFGSLGDGKSMYNFCSACYANDPQDPTDPSKRRPSISCYQNPLDTANHPGYRTCRGCMMLNNDTRMGCWCLEGSGYPEYTNEPHKSKWVTMDVTQPPKCPGVQHASFVNRAGNEMQIQCVDDLAWKSYNEILNKVLIAPEVADVLRTKSVFGVLKLADNIFNNMSQDGQVDFKGVVKDTFSLKGIVDNS
jgi:hypothetical protein